MTGIVLHESATFILKLICFRNYRPPRPSREDSDMRYMIAFDSGGTKTDTILFQEDGHILCRDISLGGNALDIGWEVARTRITDTLLRVSEKAPGPIEAAFGGVAGAIYFDPFLDYGDICRRMNAKSLRIDTDGLGLISTELSHYEDGCCMICGTGCGMWVRKKELPHPVRRGGMGYLIDTLGSGYILGRNALRAVYFATEDRCPPTVLTELVTKQLGKPMLQSIPEIYAGGRRMIASFAHTVFDGYRMGDEVCKKIMEAGASSMAELVWSCDKFFDTPYTVVMGGGIVFSFPEYVEAIRSRSPERANLILAQAPPAYGCAVEAMHDCGLDVDDTFRANFLADLKTVPVHDFS